MNPDVAEKRDRIFAALAQSSVLNGPILMGIVNATPDSFSDGGRFLAPQAAIDEAHRHAEGGAAIIDLGAESTRPGYAPVGEAEEKARLEPMLAALASLDIALSIDTTKAAIAAFALERGAAIVNDQWGLQGDPAMADIVASSQAGLVMMHNRVGTDPGLDIVDDLRRFFDRSLALAERAGIRRDRIVLDPGIGFGKTKAQNIRAIGVGVATLVRTYGCPVLMGVSRKSLFATLIGKTDANERLIGTIAANLAAYAHGARLFRVHDCAEHRDAFAVQRAIANG